MYKLIVILFAISCMEKASGQLSKDFIADIPEIGPAVSGKKVLTIKEKIKIIGHFRTSNSIPKEFIAVYDSIATSLCTDFKLTADPQQKMQIGLRLTSFYNLTGDYATSLSYTNDMLQLAEKYDTSGLLLVGHQRLKGTLLAKLGRQEEAVNFINEKLDNAKAREDNYATGLLFYALAVTYSTINLPLKCIQFVDSSFYYYDITKNKPEELKKAYSESVGVKYAQTFNLFEQTNDTVYLKEMRDVIAFAGPKKISRPFFVIFPIIESYCRKQYDTVIALCDTFLNRSSQTQLSINDYIGLVATKYKALSLYESGKQKEGVQLLEKPLQEIMANPGKDEAVIRLRLPFVYKTSRLLQEFYNANQNWDKAYHYLSINQHARDTLDFIANQGKIFEANQKYNFAKKEVKVQELEKDKAITIKERNFALFVTVTSLLLFIIIASLLYNNNRNIQYKRKIAEQAAQNELDRLNIATQLQIAELEDKNTIAKQEEQKRLGMELHDELAGDIAFLKAKIELEIGKTDDASSQDNLREISNYTGGVYEKVRKKSHTWFNNVADESDSSFKKRLQSLIDNGLPDDKYKKDILLDDYALRLLPLSVKIEIVYIIREALANILKHADASLVEIHIYEDVHGIVVAINDNGKGFDTNNLKKGIGLQSMETRVAHIRGLIAVESGKKGTQISIVIPPTMLKN